MTEERLNIANECSSKALPATLILMVCAPARHSTSPTSDSRCFTVFQWFAPIFVEIRVLSATGASESAKPASIRRRKLIGGRRHRYFPNLTLAHRFGHAVTTCGFRASGERLAMTTGQPWPQTRRSCISLTSAPATASAPQGDPVDVSKGDSVTGPTHDDALRQLAKSGANAMPDTSVHPLRMALTSFADVLIASALAVEGIAMTPLPAGVVASVLLAAVLFCSDVRSAL